MKINLIYYKNILDGVVEKFVSIYGNCFVKEGDNYVFSGGFSQCKMKNILRQYVVDAIIQVMSTVVGNYDKLIIIGSCFPSNHLLLQFKHDSYFPTKLSNLIEIKPHLKWLMKEKDIAIDIDLLNQLLIDIFNEFFMSQKKCENTFHSNDVVFIQHNSLDCYMMFKVIKWIYGNCNCTNVWKDYLTNQQCHLVAINDLISKYVQNKHEMNKSQKFREYACEIKEYLENKLQVKM